MSRRTIGAALAVTIIDEQLTDAQIEAALMLAVRALGGDRVRLNVIEMHPDTEALFPEGPELATPCTSADGRACENADHAHTGQADAAANGTGIDTGDDWLVCGECEQPMHYDYGDDQYHHDDAPACALALRGIPRPVPA